MYTMKYRPQIHYSPKRNWINDPNGLVYYKGEYHLFYQYYPYDNIWGPMHWGHAVSRDLIHWEELPIALYPDKLGEIFSGSVVVDQQNTSGFKTGKEDVLVAIFTHQGKEDQKQSIAYSNDKGRTWIKYQGNPVINNPGKENFRDPKVFWHDETKKWVMSLACGDCIYFYESLNLVNWNFLSEFGKEYGAHGGVWECPDLISLEVEGEQKKKWVLIVSMNPGGPNGGSAIQYFIGDFDGQTFTSDEAKETVRWADYGRDFFAAVTWSNLLEKIWIGWMSNWQYANEVPTAYFRNAMSIPRKLSLRKEKNTLQLIQNPINLSPLYDEIILHNENIHISSTSYTYIPLNDFLFYFETQVKSRAALLNITLKGKKEYLRIIVDRVKNEIRIDRTNSGNVSFSKAFPSIDRMPIDEISDIQLLVDRCSMELFVNNGSKVMTELFFPLEKDCVLEFDSVDGDTKLENVSVYSLKSIWR